MTMRGVWVGFVAMAMLAAPVAMRAQTGGDDASKNAAQARSALDAMVQALGGQAWLNQTNRVRQGYIAAFYHGQPNLGTTQFLEYHAWPDHDRVEYTKHRDVVQFYEGREAWEVTYQGKHALPKEQMDDFLRRRDHSVETAVKVWMKDPQTILIYEGKRLAERHLCDQVTLISAANEAVTILVDNETHLPRRIQFQWRDPLYKDKNTDAEEYDDYHLIDGFPTPLSITRFLNDEVTRQYYITKATYNQALPADFWDVNAVARRIKK